MNNNNVDVKELIKIVEKYDLTLWEVFLKIFLFYKVSGERNEKLQEEFWGLIGEKVYSIKDLINIAEIMIFAVVYTTLKDLQEKGYLEEFLKYIKLLNLLEKIKKGIKMNKRN